MFRCEAKDMINASDQNLRIPVRFAPDRKDVEQGRPDKVLHANAKGGKPQGDGVIGVRGRVGHLQVKAGNRRSLAATPSDGDR